MSENIVNRSERTLRSGNGCLFAEKGDGPEAVIVESFGHGIKGRVQILSLR
jgi:hypothetical protein